MEVKIRKKIHKHGILKKKKSNYEREIHVKYTLRHEDERHVEKKEKK